MKGILRDCDIYTDENGNAGLAELNSKTVVAAFQTWFGGSSGLHLASQDGGEEAIAQWLLDARNSGTFAQTHVFTCEEEAINAYNNLDN